MKTMHTGQGIRLITALSGLLVAMLFSTSAMAQILGTAHDFSDGSDIDAGGEICVVCHTPHNAISPDEGPLWNRSLAATTSYTLYSIDNSTPGSDIQGTGFGQPSGVSKLCLSCHDGTIAVDAFGGQAGTAAGEMNTINPAANIGGRTTSDAVGSGDLSDDHPVAFTYPTTDTEIVAAAGGLPLFGISSNQLECATCHDVHGTGNLHLLRVPNTGSDLCLTCHTK